jgi:thiamine-phosphate pyrophosphorylase
MRLHAIVNELDIARGAIEGGATVVQFRLKGAPTSEIVERGELFRALCAKRATFVVNDDVEAAIELRADGVHLGQADAGAEPALEAGLVLGISAASVAEARIAEQRGASYVGAGPVWATPSKPDADGPIGLDGLAAICKAVSIPVIAIGGIDAANAADCVRAGATGVAVVRAAAEAAGVREALDDATV